MRIPRLLFALVAMVVVLGALLVGRFVSDRSAPELGDEVVVPATSDTSPHPPSRQPAASPSAEDESARPPGRGDREAVPVPPRPAPPAGDDSDDSPDRDGDTDSDTDNDTDSDTDNDSDD